MTSSSSALLVIDLQQGAFDGVRCPPVDEPERLIANARRLVDAARAGGRTVVFVQHSEGADAPFDIDSPHGRLHESLVPGPGEPVIVKQASSSFEGTNLDAELKSRGIDALVLCGLQSEFCVSNTARAALELGYRVQVAEDGHGTWPWEGRTSTDIAAEANTRLAEAGAQLAPTAQLAESLQTPAPRP